MVVKSNSSTASGRKSIAKKRRTLVGKTTYTEATGSPTINTALGPALRRAWVGYRRLLDDELDSAGFADHGFPDGRVLGLCSRAGSVTISDIGRELGITRQGASKVVSGLHARRYVKMSTSPTDAREKIVRLTKRAKLFLDAQQRAARKIERRLRTELGPDAFEGLFALLEAVGGADQPRLHDYVRERSVLRSYEILQP
jgi:DNA-binding MarR family transcriptional regulator